MLRFDDKKEEFLSFPKLSGPQWGWAFIWGITVFFCIAMGKDAGPDGDFLDLGRNFLLWGIFLMLGMILDTLKQLLRNSDGRL